MKLTTYNYIEEKINIYSHFSGLIMSVLGSLCLIYKAWSTNNNYKLAAAIIYSLSLIILYTASTLYHAAQKPTTRRLLNIFDHAAIFILIAGTYTPFALVTLHGFWGWLLLILIWGIAITGVILKLYFTGKYETLSTLLYVIMGWMVIFFIKPLIQYLPEKGLYWLVAGGIFYTIGAIFFSIGKIKYNHAVFHIWVLLGSLAHFIAIYLYVI